MRVTCSVAVAVRWEGGGGTRQSFPLNHRYAAQSHTYSNFPEIKVYKFTGKTQEKGCKFEDAYMTKGAVGTKKACTCFQFWFNFFFYECDS